VKLRVFFNDGPRVEKFLLSCVDSEASALIRNVTGSCLSATLYTEGAI
jgi:hypothetical protein